MDHEPTGRADPQLPDLDAIAADLVAVETALDRLEDGTYWSDPLPGERPTEP